MEGSNGFKVCGGKMFFIGSLFWRYGCRLSLQCLPAGYAVF
ncbi:hypothetical protein [Prevotella fusca]|nr:hypothetical protein [Prevotella fusca]